ncbi:hypothetical protein NPIL_329231 [Nephila pilipes]|uniref:Uncharacterized protein n=1 Tax=Nephila pilipes TaxID=299642 RepID=A0A8X6UFB8_NEPPI|nr:hypothetical protein NPIL_329231 [Nephila pilipes]
MERGRYVRVRWASANSTANHSSAACLAHATPRREQQGSVTLSACTAADVCGLSPSWAITPGDHVPRTYYMPRCLFSRAVQAVRGLVACPSAFCTTRTLTSYHVRCCCYSTM